MTVEQLTNLACGESLQGAITEAINANNSVMAGCNVHFLFRGCLIDNLTGMHGLRWAIMRVLQSAPDTGLTCEEIRDIIRSSPECAALSKYPCQTYSDNLCTVLTEAGQVVGVQRSNVEDSERNSEAMIAIRFRRNAWRVANGLQPKNVLCNRPRVAWFTVPTEKE